jgi:intracellular septation protein
MKLLLDLFPIVAFFLVYAYRDIYEATLAVVVGCFIQTFGHRIWLDSFERMHVVTLALAIVFGGATLALRDPLFIQAKPSIIYVLFAGAFMASHRIGDKLLAERMLDRVLALPDSGWWRLNAVWAGFMLIMAVLNAVVAATFSERVWVHFKSYGDVIFMLLFMVGQVYVLREHLLDPVAETDSAAP